MPMIILTCLASKLSNKQVIWVEDRLEHLTAASSATGRLTKLKASINEKGLIEALDYDQIDDVGAYPRALNQHHFIECTEILVVHIK